MHDERLDVESLHLWRGDRHVLRGVCFSLASGECLQVTGPNGSGKTSLLRTVCGLMYPEEGRVLYWIGVRHRIGAAALEGALERVGASPWSDRLVRTLSAGQRRRVALAGLILSMVPLWLLDEPTTNLDTEGQQLVGSLIAEQLARGGMVVAAVHHELPASVRDLRRLELAA